MKTTKKIITLVLALALIFALAAPAFALVAANQPTVGGNSWYEQTSVSDYYVDDTFWVQLHITTAKEGTVGPIDLVYDVEMGTEYATNQLFTVLDVLNAAHQQYSTLSFDIQTVYSPKTGTYDSAVKGVMDTVIGVPWPFDEKIIYKNPDPNPDPEPYYVGGYMFRINGMVPFYTPSGSSQAWGCPINVAYVTANDTIDLYYIDIYSTNPPSKVRTLLHNSWSYNTITGGTATFKLLEASCYYDGDPTHDWVLSTWSLVKNETVGIKVDGGAATSVTTNQNGILSITGLSKGLHRFRFATIYDTSYSFHDQNNNTLAMEMPAVVGMHFERRYY